MWEWGENNTFLWQNKAQVMKALLNKPVFDNKKKRIIEIHQVDANSCQDENLRATILKQLSVAQLP